MFDPRDYPGFWGLCGGLLSGAYGLVTAYSAKAGTPEARRKAWLRLVFGVPAGLVIAEATVMWILRTVPALDMRFVSVVLGWMVTNDPRGLFNMMERVVRAVFNQEPKS
ncbi:hypothetical protein [Brevundimonas sp. GCM10030266]|uniref:hypothetical protein n=1 Tax=Brevundimonas sp. GCM10030266 TaxID=3273386 RepID=UPI00360623C9